MLAPYSIGVLWCPIEKSQILPDRNVAAHGGRVLSETAPLPWRGASGGVKGQSRRAGARSAALEAVARDRHTRNAGRVSLPAWQFWDSSEGTERLGVEVIVPGFLPLPGLRAPVFLKLVRQWSAPDKPD